MSPSSTADYDKLTLEIERVDSLLGLLADRLEALSDLSTTSTGNDGLHELHACHALNLVALGVSDRLQLIRDHASALLALAKAADNHPDQVFETGDREARGDAPGGAR